MLQSQHTKLISEDAAGSITTYCSSTTNSLGYGEIVPQTIIRAIHQIKNYSNGCLSLDTCNEQNYLLKTGGKSKVVDLGSGTGRVLFAAALTHSFAYAVGIEIVHGLHAQALQNWKRWNENELIGASRVIEPGTKFHFICGDMAEYQDMIDDASLVIVHATLFDEKLMDVVQQLCESCFSGDAACSTWFVMVSKPLRGPRFETLSVEHCRMSWGYACVYIQRSVSQ